MSKNDGFSKVSHSDSLKMISEKESNEAIFAGVLDGDGQSRKFLEAKSTFHAAKAIKVASKNKK